jgi:transposase
VPTDRIVIVDLTLRQGTAHPVIDTIKTTVPSGLEELATLGRTLHRRRDDVLAYFSHRASNGPTEAINGRLEALRRNALVFRNLINYRIRSLLHSGGLAL